uniref:2'-phosphotransferase n=1 Tax=Anthurium amnicola TaxID=1678845 RepID=A0A1D1YXX9_9ARAE
MYTGKVTDSTILSRPLSLSLPLFLMLAWAGGGAALAFRCSSAASCLLTPSLLPAASLFASRRLRMEGNGRSFSDSRNRPSSSHSRLSPPAALASSVSGRSGRGRGGKGLESGRPRGDRHRGRGGGDDNRIDALGRLLTRILRHMASELKLDMRSDGYVRVSDLLRLNVATHAKVPLRSHTVDDVKEAVRRDNKQRFSLLEESGELLVRANQGHTITRLFPALNQ